MSSRHSARLLLLCTLGLGTTTATGSGSSELAFTPLGDLAGGSVSSTARGISADGSTICGLSSSTASATDPGDEAFRWREAGGMVGLGDLAGSPYSSEATGLSADGNVAAGFGTMGIGIIRATRWTQGSPPSQLGTLNTSGFRFSAATGISDDGLRLVGDSTSSSGFRAFLWTSASGLQNLGVLPFGNTRSSSAKGISGDGSTVVGSSSYQITEDDDNDPETPPIVIESGSRAFRWTDGEGMVELPDLEGGGLGAEARAASADGSVIVGFAQSSFVNEEEETEGLLTGAIWRDGELETIGDLAGGAVNSRLNDVSGDGSIMVGRAQDESGNVAILWDAGHGIRRLDTLLADAGIDLAGWILTSAVGISADGDVIAGNGINPSGFNEAWRVSGVLGLFAPQDPVVTLELGPYLEFATAPGNLYQVESSANSVDWSPLGDPVSTVGNGTAGSHAVVLPDAPLEFRVILLPGSADAGSVAHTLGEGAVLGFTPEPGLVYQLRHSPALAAWSAVGAAIDTGADTASNPRAVADPFELGPAPSPASGFYRLDFDVVP